MYQPYIMKYKFNALEPYISERTLENHYNNHYLNYLRNLNNILVRNNFQYQYPISKLFDNIESFPLIDRDLILYNAGGVINHELYFNSMSPKLGSTIPEPLNSALISRYGSIEQFKNIFSALAESLPGSGYTFLVLKPNRELYLLNLSNQDSPYSFGMIPLFNIDVWEHAYYLDRLSDRKKYIEAFLKVASFTEANLLYKENINKLSK